MVVVHELPRWRRASRLLRSAWLFVVKVQIQPGATSEAHGAMVYDRTKETNFILPAAMSEEFDKVHAAVESKGIKG